MVSNENNMSSAADCLNMDTAWFDTLLMSVRKKREHKIDLCGASKKTKQNKIMRCNRYLFFKLKFFIHCIVSKLSKFNYLKFQHCSNLSLWRFQAKELSFTVTFIINTLIVKVNQNNIMQPIKDNYVSVGIG